MRMGKIINKMHKVVISTKKTTINQIVLVYDYYYIL